jgi:hypothetical protein
MRSEINTRARARTHTHTQRERERERERERAGHQWWWWCGASGHGYGWDGFGRRRHHLGWLQDPRRRRDSWAILGSLSCVGRAAACSHSQRPSQRIGLPFLFFLTSEPAFIESNVLPSLFPSSSSLL